ncbi:hypothetical protein EVAR_84541_1 [Eumeta japonica]|uniref:Uncharacterized protein n=1 Tax=Eumeta variegata TaxID=151549 RepID=A0A4C1UJ33_EUMVA|nr:hypothetical protein EVAR_84541_1 [Eumeta japonica]
MQVEIENGITKTKNVKVVNLAETREWAGSIVVTFPDVHVSAGEDMPSSSRALRVSSPTEKLLDPESGSSYDDSDFFDDDDVEY